MKKKTLAQLSIVLPFLLSSSRKKGGKNQKPSNVIYDSNGTAYRVEYAMKFLPAAYPLAYTRSIQWMDGYLPRPFPNYGEDQFALLAANTGPSVLPSNYVWNLNKTPELYPSEFQARDLSSSVEQAKIRNMVLEFDPVRVVAPSLDPTMGPPVVWNPFGDNVSFVLAGNSRTIALARWITFHGSKSVKTNEEHKRAKEYYDLIRQQYGKSFLRDLEKKLQEQGHWYPKELSPTTGKPYKRSDYADLQRMVNNRRQVSNDLSGDKFGRLSSNSLPKKMEKLQGEGEEALYEFIQELVDMSGLWILVRVVKNMDGSDLSFEQAVQLAGASQASAAGQETPLRKSISRFRSWGAPNVSSMPSIPNPMPLNKDTIRKFIEKNPAFWNWCLDSVPSMLRSSALNQRGVSIRFDIISSMLVGLFIPTTIIEEGFSSESEERVVMSMLPYVASLHQKVFQGEIYPYYDLLPYWETAREFCEITKGKGYSQAIQWYNSRCDKNQIKMFDNIPDPICEMNKLGVAMAFFIKHASNLANPSSSISRLGNYIEEARKQDPRQITLMGMVSQSEEQREEKAYTTFLDTVLPKKITSVLQRGQFT